MFAAHPLCFYGFESDKWRRFYLMLIVEYKYQYVVDLICRFNFKTLITWAWFWVGVLVWVFGSMFSMEWNGFSGKNSALYFKSQQWVFENQKLTQNGVCALHVILLFLMETNWNVNWQVKIFHLATMHFSSSFLLTGDMNPKFRWLHPNQSIICTLIGYF